MKNILQNSWILLLLVLHISSFGMQNQNEMRALGMYYHMYRTAPTNQDKIYYLLMALREHAPDTNAYQLLKDLLLIQGFDVINDDINSFMIAYLTEMHRAGVQQEGSVEGKLNYIKWRMGRTTDPLELHALQILLDELYGAEI